jgi:hypothetical protein
MLPLAFLPPCFKHCMQARARRCRVEAQGLALQLGPLAALARASILRDGDGLLGHERPSDLHRPRHERIPTNTSTTELASGLSCERVEEGRLALALRRLVSRDMGLRLVLVRFRFLFFPISFLSLRHGDLLFVHLTCHVSTGPRKLIR